MPLAGRGINQIRLCRGLFAVHRFQTIEFCLFLGYMQGTVGLQGSIFESWNKQIQREKTSGQIEPSVIQYQSVELGREKHRPRGVRVI